MKRLFSVCLIVAVLTLGVCIATDTSFANSFRNNLENTGTYDAEGVSRVKAINWKFQAGDAIISSPTLYHGVIYFGSDDTYLYAVDQKTGEQIWKFKTDGIIRSTPAIEKGTVFISSNDGHLYAINANNGKLMWKYDTGVKDERFDNWDYYQTSPLVYNKMVFFGGWDGHIYGANMFTGEIMKKFAVGLTHSTPTIANDKLYVATLEKGITAYDIQTEEKVWATEEFPTVSSVIYHDGLVYIGVRHADCVRAFDADTGRLVWKYNSPHGSWVQSTPSIHDGVLYAGSSDDFLIYAIDARTGQEIWTSAVPDAVHSSPAYANGIIYFGTSDNYGGGKDEGYIYAMDAQTGEALWKVERPAMIHASPIIDGTNLYIATCNGILYSLK